MYLMPAVQDKQEKQKGAEVWRAQEVLSNNNS